MALDGSLLEPSVNGFVNKGKVRNDDGDGSASDENGLASKDCQSADDLEEGELEEDDECEEEVESVKLQPSEPAAPVVATEPEALKESPAPAQSRLPATIPSLLDMNIPPPDSRFLKSLGKTLPTWAKGASYRRKRYPGSDGEDSDDEGVDDTYKLQRLRKRRQNSRRMRDRYAGYGLDDDDEMDGTDHQKWFQTSSNITKKKALSKDTGAPSPPSHSPYASPPGPYDSPSEPEAEDDIALASKVDTKELKSKANEDTAISKNSGEDSTAKTVSGGDDSQKLALQSAADYCSNTNDVAQVELRDSVKGSKSPLNEVDLVNVEEHKKDDIRRPENTFSSFGRRVEKNVLSSTRQQDSQMSEQQPLTKKRKLRLAETPWEDRPVCRFFQEGKCIKGSECPFNHTGPQNHPTQKNKPPTLCRYYQRTGDCNRGSECRYYHETWPCPAFHKTGSKGCPDGEKCKYSHADLTDETRALVEQQENQPSEDGGEQKKKPLLGNFQQTSENKIPSLFDLNLTVQQVKGGSAGLQMGPRGFPVKPGLLGIRPQQPRARMGSMQLMRMGAGTGFFRGPRPPRMPHQVMPPSQNFDTDTKSQHTMSSNSVKDDGSVEKLVNGAQSNSDVTMATMDALNATSPASIESHQKPEYLVTVSHPALQTMHGSLPAAASSIADPNLCTAPSFNSLNSAQSNASMQSSVTISSVPLQSALLPEPTIVAGVDLTQLQPAQRELFLRLNQSSQKPQQSNSCSSSTASAQQAETTAAAPLQSNVGHVANVVHTNDTSQSAVTGGGGTFQLSKINDLLKVLSQQPSASAISSNGTDGSQQLPLAPVFDIHQVLSAITHVPSTVSAVSTGPVKAAAAAIQEPGDAELEVNGLRATIEYNPKPYENLGTVIPADMVLDDPRWDEDPRVQRWRREVELGRMPRREVRNKPAVSTTATAVPQRDPRRRNDTPAAAAAVVVSSAAAQPTTGQVPVEQQQMHIQQFVQQMINMQQPPPATGFPSQLMASTAPPRIPVPLLMSGLSAPSVMFPGNMVGLPMPPRTTGMMPVPLVDVRAAQSAFPAVVPASIGAVAPAIGMPAVPQCSIAPSMFPPIFNPCYPPPFMMPRGPLQGNVPVIPPTMNVPPPNQATAVPATAVAAAAAATSAVVSLHHDTVKTVDEHSATPLHAVTTYVSSVLNESVFETAEVKSDQSRKFVDSRFKKQTLPNVGDSEVVGERKLPSNDNPTEETAWESVRDKKVLQFQSPLAETGSTRLSSGYNRPPNKRYQELIEQNGNRDNRRPKTSNNAPHSVARKTGFGTVGPTEPDADMPHLIPAIATPTLPVTKCPPTLMNEDTRAAAQSAAEGSLKDMFKTIDPTASPFC